MSKIPVEFVGWPLNNTQSCTVSPQASWSAGGCRGISGVMEFLLQKFDFFIGCLLQQN